MIRLFQQHPTWGPCRRSNALPRDSSIPSRGLQSTLTPHLATYLLCLVGYVLEGYPQNGQDPVAVVSKAVAVYKLLKQVCVLKFSDVQCLPGVLRPFLCLCVVCPLSQCTTHFAVVGMREAVLMAVAKFGLLNQVCFRTRQHSDFLIVLCALPCVTARNTSSSATR